MIRIEDIDFIDIYNWLWYRHKDHKLSYDQFHNIVDSYCGLKYGEIPNDDVNVHIIDALIDIELLRQIGDRLSIVFFDDIG